VDDQREIDRALEQRQFAFLDQGGGIGLALRPVHDAALRHHEHQAALGAVDGLIKIGYGKAEPQDGGALKIAEVFAQAMRESAAGSPGRACCHKIHVDRQHPLWER